MSDLRHAGMHWPNGAVDKAAILALPSPELLMLATEGRYHLDKAVAAGKQVTWRAIPRVGKRPAELGWSPGRYVEEVLNLTDEPTTPIGALIWGNEFDLQDERGDHEDDWSNLATRYALIGGWARSVIDGLRQHFGQQTRIHWPAWTPDHDAFNYWSSWRLAAESSDVVDFHAYDSLAAIETQYHNYRLAFPNHALALTEWHCRGDLDEERRVLAWLADTMRADPLFDAAYFFIWRWHRSPDWWDDRWDVEHSPDRYALFRDPPVVREAPMPDLRAYAREAAGRAGIDAGLFERQIDQESGFNPDAHNDASGADGIAQIVVRWHPSMAGKTRDPLASLDYAARLMRGYLDANNGSYPRALASYNWGSGNVAGWDGKRSTLPAETRQYLDVILGSGWEAAPARVTFAPEYPAVIQDDQFSCAPTALTWAMRSLGRRPGDNWIERDMVERNLVSHDDGLLDHRGAGIVAWLSIDDADHYGSDGYGASNWQNPISWDELVPEIDPHPPYPILLGLPNWSLAGGGHWVGVRGFKDGRIVLANPAQGETYGQVSLSREQFEARAAGNASIVRVLHPDLIPVPTPAPVPPPVDPKAKIREQVAAVASALEQVDAALKAGRAAIDALKQEVGV